MNVFFVGDELVCGKGDPKALGWTGRVAARTLPADETLTFHELAVPGETTSEMAARWRGEVVRRVTTREPSAIVFAVGRHDARKSVSSSMTRLNLADSLDKAKEMGFRVMVVGPPPGAARENEAIAELAAVAEDAAERRDVPYIDTYGPLAAHAQWLTDMESGESGLPGQAGYGLMAWLVLHSQWRVWLGLPEVG